MQIWILSLMEYLLSQQQQVNTFIYFQIIAPTALALLSPDNADITV